jgi:hypothetical protein
MVFIKACFSIFYTLIYGFRARRYVKRIKKQMMTIGYVSPVIASDIIRLCSRRM